MLDTEQKNATARDPRPESTDRRAGGYTEKDGHGKLQKRRGGG